MTASTRALRVGESLRMPKAAERIAAQLRLQIVTGELPEGTYLQSEAAMLETYGISRPTLREAIRVLESESLITVHRGSKGGIQVNVPRSDVAARYAGLLLEFRGATLDDVFTAATAIEAPCAATLARKHTRNDIRDLRAIIQAEKKAISNPQQKLELHNQFNQLLVELVHNDALLVLSQMLGHIIDAASVRYLSKHRLDADLLSSASRTSTRGHEKLVDLIEARDADGAEKLRYRQIAETGKFLKKSGVGQSVIDLLE